MSNLLSVENLAVEFDTDGGKLRAVDGVSFDVPSGGTVALVGESGCGKSVTAHAIMRLLPGNARLCSGRVLFDGENLLELSERKMRKLRGKTVSLVFQDPKTALNPSYSIGAQLCEAYRIHNRASRAAARDRAIKLLERVNYPQPDARFDNFPHELSGGMRQRVLIAMALVCGPRLMIADEPTTALDMLAAAQVTALLADLRRDKELSVLMISHDITLVRDVADDLVVMYAGQVVEQGPTSEVLAAPKHPYTRGLLRSIPPMRTTRRRRQKTPTRIPMIEGSVPSPQEMPSGCRFAPRCGDVMPECHAVMPDLISPSAERRVRCLLYSEDEA